MHCPICGGSHVHAILHRSQMPINQNTLFEYEEDARGCQKKDLEISICEDCGFVFNSQFDSSLDLYSHNYNNAQIGSADFLSYMKSSIDYVWNNYFAGKGYPRKVYEIGCGRNADYIKLIYAKLCSLNLASNVEIVGFDPASSDYDDKNIRIYPRYFDFENENCEGMDWLVSRHVVEHLSDPLVLFKKVHGLDKGNRQAIGFFETPDVEWIFKNNTAFDFFYEHCSLFSNSSILKVGELLGINVQEIKKVFNGQYMWIIMNKQPYIDNRNEFKNSLNNILCLSDKYRICENIILEKIHSLISTKRREGKLVIWGAGAKGNIFLNLFDPECEIIDAVIDINYEKWGKYIAGTRHCIMPPDILEKDNIRTVIVMNSIYFNEIASDIFRRNTKVDDIITIDTLLENPDK